MGGSYFGLNEETTSHADLVPIGAGLHGSRTELALRKAQIPTSGAMGSPSHLTEA